MPIILSAPAKRRTNGSRRDVLSEDARKSGYYVATYSPGDGKTRYRFFDLADMARRGVSTAEQDYFGPLNGIHTAVGLAAAKKFLNAPTKRMNTRKAALPPMRNNGAEESPFHDVLVAHGWVYSHSTPIHRPSGRVTTHATYTHPSDAAGKKYPRVGVDGGVWSAGMGGSARMVTGRTAAELTKYLKGALSRGAKKAPAKRTNGSRSVVDTVAARELELYIENERNLVGPGNTLGANIMRMLAGRIVRGTYDATKAWKAWVPLVTEGAKRYKREHGAINASKATRDAVATRLSEAFEAEVRVGALDPMKLLGAR